MTPTLQQLAAAIANWFPELGNRSLAVSEAEITKENVPTLPLAMTSLGNVKANHFERSNGRVEIEERIYVQFWFAPERYKLANGSESPFWAFYDYGSLLDRLTAQIIDWRSPRNGRLRFISMDQEAEQYAVLLTFTFDHCFTWCEPERGPDYAPINFTIGTNFYPGEQKHVAGENPDC